jgi:glycosyltransferase involved in cell wall biosynthesis
MNLAISLTTFQRQDGKSPFYLKRSLDSVFSQTHEDFLVIVVGDCYEDRNEFESIIEPYKCDRLISFNLERSIERDKYKDNKIALWQCAGITPMNFASQKALELDFTYVCHLDHDDYWYPHHLQKLNETIEKYKADWLCTQSAWVTGALPEISYSSDKVIPFLPKCGHVINSSTCYNYKTIPLRYRNAYEECGGLLIPSDGDLWDRMSKYIVERNLSSYFVPALTCVHDEEGYLKQ